MKPEVMTIQMTDGTEFMFQAHMESGKLHIAAGGFVGVTFVLEPSSAMDVCERIIELLSGRKIIHVTEEQILGGGQ